VYYLKLKKKNMSVNKVILIGNLGKDPEVRIFDSGKKKANFTLATSEKYNDVTKTEWHNIDIWGKLADVAETYLKKGSKIYVEGRISYETYDDKDGVKKYITKITADSFKMLDSKGSGESSSSSTPAAKAETSADNYMHKKTEPAVATKKAQPEAVSSVQNSSFTDEADDLPF